MTSRPNSLARSWFQCKTCWKIFNLRIQLAMHLQKRHNEGGFVRNTYGGELSQEGNRNDRGEGEKVVKSTQNMGAFRAASAFMCAFDCNEQFTDLKMWFAHSLEAHKSEISQPRKSFPNNRSPEFSSQQTIMKTLTKEIPVYDISSSEDESTLPANSKCERRAEVKEIPVYDIYSSEDESTLPANSKCERRAEVDERAPVTACEGLGKSNSGTSTKLVRQHKPESTFPSSQSNHPRTFSPFTSTKGKDGTLTSNGLRQGVIQHKRRPRRCPYCSQTFLLSVDTYRHIKAVHGKLITQNDSVESKKSIIDTSERATISSQSSHPSKSYTDDTRPDVSSDSTYSIQGYKCKLCLKTFRRMAVFKSHFRVRHEFVPYIPSFVLRHQQSEQLSLSSTRSLKEGKIFSEVEKMQQSQSVDLIVDSSTANQSRSDSREVEPRTKRRESSVLLESEARKTRAARRTKSVKILDDPPVQVEGLKRKRKAKLKYKCPSCPKIFRSLSCRDDHFTVHSGQKRYKCPVCDRRIRYHNNFKKHMKKFHDHPNYNVEEAVDGNIEVAELRESSQESEQLPSPARSPNEGKILMEVETVKKSVDLIVHSGTANKSSESQEVESNTSRGESSMLLERKANKTRTDRRSKSIEVLNDPPEQVEGLEMNRKAKLRFKCPTCPKLFSERRLRDDHFTIHYGKKLYKCHLCNRRIRFHQNFQRHMKTSHDHPNYNVEEAVDDNIEVPRTQESQEVISFLVTYNAATKSVHVALPKQV